MLDQYDALDATFARIMPEVGPIQEGFNARRTARRRMQGDTATSRAGRGDRRRFGASLSASATIVGVQMASNATNQTNPPTAQPAGVGPLRGVCLVARSPHPLHWNYGY